MKKFLIIACVLSATSFMAMTLPDTGPVVSYEKMTIEPISLFADVVLLVDNDVVFDFVVEPKNPVQLQTFNYVAVNVMESQGFCKPIDYESFTKINPLSHYDIYNGRDLFKNELFVDNQFRIQNIPRKLVF